MVPFDSSDSGTLARFLAAVGLLVLFVGGCSGTPSTGRLTSESLGADPVVLGSSYTTVVYTHDPMSDTSFFLTDLPVEDLLAGTVTDGQVVHVELLWVPKAGATPMDSSATNASIRQVVISRGEVGIYGGAGFAMPIGSVGSPSLRLKIRDATVRLLEATEGFVDPLSPARLTGDFTARLDSRTATKVHRGISQLVTNALGRRRFVSGHDMSVSEPRWEIRRLVDGSSRSVRKSVAAD